MTVENKESVERRNIKRKKRILKAIKNEQKLKSLKKFCTQDNWSSVIIFYLIFLPSPKKKTTFPSISV